MGWLSIALQVIGMIWKYGPTLWNLGVKIYEVVDKIINEFKSKNPQATPVEIKTLADSTFDEELVKATTDARMVVPAPVTRTQLRRDVWGTRKENNKKVVLGRKPT